MSSDRSKDTPTEAHSSKKKIPPLVWIVAAIFVGWLAIFLVQRDGQMVTPSGGTHPTAAEGDAVSPATPATPAAPGTPATTNAP